MRAQNTTTNRSSLHQYLNERIKFSTLLLINEQGKNVGLVEREEALRIARNSQLDLFCITPHTSPPVCKILDFSKHIYQTRRKNTGKTISRKNLVKEAKFSFAISENDAAVKVRRILKWLANGSTIKVVLFMRGREQQHKDLALQKVNKILAAVADASPSFQLRDEVKLVGNTYFLTLSGSKKT